MKALSAAPIPVVLVVLSFLAPTELSLFVAGLRLPPHRIALIAVIGFALGRFATGKVRLKSYDVLFALFAIWTAVVFQIHGGHAGLVYGGSLALESFGSYIVARAFIRTSGQYLASLALLLSLVAVTAILALPEMLLGRHFTHDTLQSLTGYAVERAVEVRKGFTRAYGTFDHPIHLGVFCSSVLALAWYTAGGNMQRLRRAALVVLTTLAALSSAPLLCLALQIGLMLWERSTRAMPRRVAVTMAAVAGLYLGLSLVMTRSPIQLIATGLTLDSWTGYYRMLIWEHGIQNVLAHPLIGIGQGDWERPHWMVASTVDAFWLVIAMTQGIPALVLLLAAITLLLRAVARRMRRTRNPMERRIGRAWTMALVALSLMATTVHLWNVPYAYFFFFLGSAGWLADPARVGKRRRATLPAGAATGERLPSLMGQGWPATTRTGRAGGFATQTV